MTPPAPLQGLRVVEFGSIGPGPHCGMLLSDLGAEVLRIERPEGSPWPNPVADRGRALLHLDIQTPEGCAAALRIVDRADVLIEGMRPGVMERLGMGPEIACARNPRLVYGRMTGWGQAGPLAATAGHDINYIALTGALAAIGTPGAPPPPPLNLVGDFGGGSLYLALGVMAALWERNTSGKGQVVDAAIVDGVTSMMSMFWGLADRIDLARGRNMLGGAAPFYRCYACADGQYVAVGAIEPKFYATLIAKLGLPEEIAAQQFDETRWSQVGDLLAGIFVERPRDAWARLFDGSDACVTPVLTLAESIQHPHMIARNAYSDRDGIPHCAPTPRFSRTPGRIADAVDVERLLAEWGV